MDLWGCKYWSTFCLLHELFHQVFSLSRKIPSCNLRSDLLFKTWITIFLEQLWKIKLRMCWVIWEMRKQKIKMMNLSSVEVSSFSVMLAATKHYSVSRKHEEFQGRGKTWKMASGDSMKSVWKNCKWLGDVIRHEHRKQSEGKSIEKRTPAW